MTDRKIKVFFLGSGIIAVPSLVALQNAPDIDLVGVGTQPDKKAGRGNKMTPTPVGQKADELGLEPWKIDNINNQDYLNRLHSLQPDFIVVIAFGQLLKESVLELPAISCINVHASILPKYRGASPINASILAGDKKTGITFMKMEKGLDSGPVFKVLEVEIDEKDNTETLQDKLAELSALNIATILKNILNGKLTSVEQDHNLATHCKKIKKTDALIDWDVDARTVKSRIHGYFPWPVAYFFLEGPKGSKRISIVSARTCEEKTDEESGTVLDGGKNQWLMACGNNTVLEILKVKPEGKQVMAGSDFLRGSQIQAGDNLKIRSLTN
ncbi:MAG: methionyl-tRNA formyltransferase [Lentisphaeraceae bacterium]|nr:methionyl-tRNA formyltransferase [Lentisphaeraceae bacterium]